MLQTVDRIMKIVEVFISNEPNRYLSITEIAKQTNLPLSSLHRILQAMIKHKMIKQDKDRKLYTLGTIWLEYGLKIYDTMDYVSHVRPELENLMKTVNSSVYLSRPDEEDSIIIERIDCVSQTIRTYDKIGLRVPFHKGIANLAMLANMEEDDQQKIKENLKVDWREREEQLQKVREQGYAIGEDEWSSDVITIATPIVNHYRKVVGAVSVKLAKSNEEEAYNDVIKELIDTGNKISWKLDYHH